VLKRILIPTDGSTIARKAIRDGVALARQLGASVVGYHAAETVQLVFNAELAGTHPMLITQMKKRFAEMGQTYLAEIENACEAAGVPCETAMTTPGAPHKGIIDTARKKKCGMIFMASHGRGQIATLVLGSVTQKVLAHSTIPVLVYR
jgi:nucleotide-binding universal stress UspA family protein